jgi:hypothetical protein
MQPMRRGNRQLNTALHRIAVVQIRLRDCPGQIYVQRRVEDGDSKSQAIRSLKRRLARVVYQALVDDRGCAAGHAAWASSSDDPSLPVLVIGGQMLISGSPDRPKVVRNLRDCGP